ncbi:transglutaminase family protein [Nubsella zeaxanthinifaciens]|jgi:transglutaminase-like putative cysteine protease|uniref:transglutaminase family protein n=1 Tax=Nubsella zeaxanthinifaciens TaxID=392412 RepID=UPI000DE42061|nr:transglutaminase family protein [Nubsella zeaxanthinifaciens]
MPTYHVKHLTKYTYPSAVTDSANQIILSPTSTQFQDIISHQIKISPSTSIDSFYDYFGNKVGVFTIVQPHTELSILVEAEVSTKQIPPPNDFWPAKAQWENLASLHQHIDFLDFMKANYVAALTEIKQHTDELVDQQLTIFQFVNKLSTYVYETLTYQKGVTDVETDIDQIWSLKAGVCQDFAHLLIEMLRMYKVPSRYVSGYICPAGNELRGIGATHAWVEAYIPDYGWMGIDPTNNCLVGDRHIRIAFGRNFKDCTPVKGTYKGSSAHSLSVAVIITNEKLKQEEEAVAVDSVYVKEVEEPVTIVNSYQRFIEMQQQQQQQ